jgi:hypothetical protein
MRRTLAWLALASGLIGAGMMESLAQQPAGAVAAPKGIASAKKPAAPQGPTKLGEQQVGRVAESPLPVQHVTQLGIQPCIGVMDKMARGNLNQHYEAQSAWNKDAPAEHVFQSVVVMHTPQGMPQDVLVALTATPTPNGACDGVTVQVFPLAVDCQSVKKQMENNGSTSRPIINALVVFDKNGQRIFLLPGMANTCIAVAVDSTYGVPPKK